MADQAPNRSCDGHERQRLQGYERELLSPMKHYYTCGDVSGVRAILQATFDQTSQGTWAGWKSVGRESLFLPSTDMPFFIHAPDETSCKDSHAPATAEERGANDSGSASF